MALAPFLLGCCVGSLSASLWWWLRRAPTPGRDASRTSTGVVTVQTRPSIARTPIESKDKNSVWKPEHPGATLQLAGLVHELRTPLAAIRAYAELLASAASDPAFLEEASTILVREAERLDTLIGSHLDRVHHLPERHPPTFGATCELGAVASEVAELLRPLSASRRIAIVLPSDAESVEAYGDRALVSQIVANLLGNALKHASGATRIQLRWMRVGTEVWLEVEDDGIGIDAERAVALFQPFGDSASRRGEDQGYAPRHSHAQGHGLGLWVAREFARRCEGELEWMARADQQRGALFRLRLASATSSADCTKLSST